MNRCSARHLLFRHVDTSSITVRRILSTTVRFCHSQAFESDPQTSSPLRPLSTIHFDSSTDNLVGNVSTVTLSKLLLPCITSLRNALIHVVASHPHRESSTSVASLGPPISMYNRSYNHHKDSTSSMGNDSQSYGQGRCASWASPEVSIESMVSDVSGVHLGRPGLGDERFDTALESGMRLTAISASPPKSLLMLGTRIALPITPL